MGPVRPRPLPDRALAARLGPRVAGIDEAGRGPWAGPVFAAAVILDPARVPDGIDDSKRLAPARRAALLDLLLETAEIGVGEASVAEIDAMNVGQATHLAMRRAVADLHAPPREILVDGPHVPAGLPCPARPVVRGDATVLAIAAASIVAKVLRDRRMAELAGSFPGYGWERNAGYGVPEHAAALRRLGLTPHHRRSFRPIHKILSEGLSIKY